MFKLFVLLSFSVAFAFGDEFFFRREYARTPVGNAIDEASMRLLKDIYNESEDKNVVTSPLGIFMLLSLYSTGTEGKIQEEIVNLLGLPDYKRMTESYQSLTDIFSSMDPEFLTLANKVCVSNKYELTDEFRTVATRDYHSEVDTLNFTNPLAAAEIINQWADLKTRGHIKNPVSEDTFPPDTAAALFNIIFFQGHWHVPFDKADTIEKDFRLSRTDSVKKPTMHLVQSLFYHENYDLGAKMVELPYKEEGFRMIVVLPDAVDGLPSVIDKLADKGILEDVVSLEQPGQDVDFDMPKFDVKSKFNLKEILIKEGVSGIFNAEAAGVVKGQGVVVSEVFQEAFVKVDEEGATAGAFTGLVLIPTALFSKPPPALPFKVDRPFLYVILYENIVMFVGTYTH